MRFTLLLVLTLLACTSHHYPTQLVVADSLCAVNPDSALRILKLMEDRCRRQVRPTACTTSY